MEENFDPHGHLSPVSMDADDETNENSIGRNEPYPHFVCLGGVQNKHLEFHPDSYLKRKELLKILNKEDAYFDQFETELTEFFGFNFLTETCLIDSIDQLFYISRKNYNKIKSIAAESSQRIVSIRNEKDCLENRLQIVKFLSFLKSYVARNINEEASETDVITLVNHVKSLLLHVGRLANSSVHLSLQTPAKTQIYSSHYHFYHLNLDLSWSIGVIFYLLPANFSASYHIKLTDEPALRSQNLFLQFAHFVLRDLVILASRRFKKLSLHQYLSTSPFTCSCVVEIWILFLRILDQNQEKQKGKSFWTHMQLLFHELLYEKLNNDRVNELNSDVLDFEAKVECEDRLGFCWWILLHLSSLYEIDVYGFRSSDEVKSNYTLLQTLIALSLQSEKVDEGHMRCYINCCIQICSQWEPNVDVLSPLWNHFLRHINSNFCLPYSLEGLQNLCVSGVAWLNQIKERAENVGNGENSFHLFLHFFCNILNRICNEDWNRFKTRIFSKLDSNFMKNLNETGLNNFLTLLLTVAYKKELISASEKLLEFLQMMPISTRLANQRIIIWSGAFAFLELLEEKQIDLTFLATKISNEFAATAQQLKCTRPDVMERNNLMKFILLHLKGIESLIDKSKNLNLSEHLLINEGLSVVLSVGNIEEIEQLLSMIETALSKLRMSFMRSKNSTNRNTQLNSVANTLVKHILPFVKHFCTTQTPPTVLADVAAGFTLMAFDMSLGIDVSLLFHHFALNSDVVPNFSCRYLCHLLHQKTLMQELHIEKTNIQYLILGSWFRCIISLPENKENVYQLTRLIMKLPEMQIALSDDDENLALQFLRALEIKFNVIENFSEKMRFKQNSEIIFKDILKHNNSVLKNYEPVSQLKQMYEISANLVKHCSHIIYFKSKANGVLHSIVHLLLLPRIIYCHDKPLPPNLSIVLRDTLHLFVEGLLRLGPKRDTCISNRLKDIVIQYVIRFSPKAKLGITTGVPHPLMICLQKCQNVHHLEEFFSFALDVIKDQIKKKNQHLITFVNFVFELLSNSTEDEKITQVLFVPLLSATLQSDPNLKERLFLLTSKMLALIAKSDTSKEIIKDQFSLFLCENMHSSSQNLFKLLNSLSELQPEFLRDQIPVIANSIEKTEEKRGVGQDSGLRNQHQKLLKKLSF